MRLIDRVRIRLGGIPDDLPIIVADPVAQQIDQLPGDTWSHSPPAEAYGCVAPPFKQFFVEAETTVNLAELGSIGMQVIQRGVLVEVEDRESGWAQWIPQFVEVGKTYHSTPMVKRFNRTNNCQVYSESQANDYLTIKAVIPTWISPANIDIVLNDVLVIEWRSGTSDLSVSPNETYYFAKNIGYCGWGSHFIVEIADGQAPLTGKLDCGM